MAQPAEAAAPMLLGGHRGCGENVLTAAGVVYPAFRENTIKSFQHAAARGCNFVEFDVQVTKDGVPVVWHDNVILTGSPASPTSQSVKDLTAAELQALWAAPGPSLLRRFHDHDTHQWRNGLEPWVCQEEDVPPLLADVFKAVPQGCGFDVEVKMTTGPEVVRTPAEEIDRMLSAILPVVAAHAQGRTVFYSCFDPDVCTELTRRQSTHPVYFLSGCGLYEHADPRRTSLPAALAVATEGGLAGIVTPASVVLTQEGAMESARDCGLQVMTYGVECDDEALTARQAELGVAAVIFDEVDIVMGRRTLPAA